MADKFEKFTERARKVFSLAQEEARRLNHNYIGTEHLLLALVREGDGIAARVLANLGIQLPEVRAVVVGIVGEGKDEMIGDPSLTPRAKKMIELAMDEARRLNNHYIGTEHLLLGLVREGEGIAAGALESLGVSLEKVRQQVMQVVSQSSSYQQSKRSDSDVSAQPDYRVVPNPGLDEMVYPFRLRREDFGNLVKIGIRLNRTIDDLVVEAIQRTWLAEEGDAETPPPPTPPPQAGEGNL